MTINFDALPKERPENEYPLAPEGFHKATINKTTVKTSAKGNDYLEVQLKLDSGETVFDIIMNSDKPALQYKIARFITACKIPLVGELSLADLGRVVLNKQVVVDIEHKTSTYQGKERTRAEVAMFKNDIYYQPEEYSALIGEAVTESPAGTTTGSY